MISFRIGGIRVRVSFSFLMFNALIFLVRESKVILCFYGVCILHELGHILAAVIAGTAAKEIILSGTGITITAEKNAVIPVKRSLFVLLSGPAVNLIFAGITESLGGSRLFIMLNLTLCLYNLLPFPNLDGGAVIELLISGIRCEYGVRMLLAAVRYGLPVAAAAAVFLGIREFLPIFSVLLLLNITNWINNGKKAKKM